MRTALLLGRDHRELGAVAERADAEIAVALSRGGAAKPYAHAEPNEDVALAARGERGFLVAVADGHWGHRAAEDAISQLRNTALADWLDGAERSGDRWYQDCLHALVAANDAIVDGHTAESKSRTTLALALVRPAERLLLAASVGDSHLFVADPEGGATALLPGRKFVFLGHERWSPSQLERGARIEIRPLDAVAAVLAVTDGLSEEGIGVEDPLAAVRLALARARRADAPERARATARSIVDTALAAHRENDAGDNVCAAVAWIG